MKLIAIEPVHHNGKRYEPGEDFEADKKSAAVLLAGGQASEAPKAKPVQPPATGDAAQGANGDGAPATDTTDPAQP